MSQFIGGIVSGSVNPLAQTTNTVEYLVVGGGGSGGGHTTAHYFGAGGGGAGGLLTSAGYVITPGVTYTITIGTGGAIPTVVNSRGVSGSNSSFGIGSSTYTADISGTIIGVGGGGGAAPSYNGTGGNPSSGAVYGPGFPGGSGGGGAYDPSPAGVSYGSPGAWMVPGPQGYPGGGGNIEPENSPSGWPGNPGSVGFQSGYGGGGGAGSSGWGGRSTSPSQSGTSQWTRTQWCSRGGAGLVSLITGERRVFASGGTTGVYRGSSQGYNQDGTQGEWNGDGTAAGSWFTRGQGVINGTGNGGSGGNGGFGGEGSQGSSGANGIVVIRYSSLAAPPIAITGVSQVNFADGYQIYIWNSSGTITF
jgi:hypothetical protein